MEDDSRVYQVGINADVTEDDILWIYLEAKCVQSKRETGEALIECSLDKLNDGKYDWPPVFERGLSVGKNWTTFEIPFLASRTALNGSSKFVLKFGINQIVKIRGLSP